MTGQQTSKRVLLRVTQVLLPTGDVVISLDCLNSYIFCQKCSARAVISSRILLRNIKNAVHFSETVGRFWIRYLKSQPIMEIQELDRNSPWNPWNPSPSPPKKSSSTPPQVMNNDGSTYFWKSSMQRVTPVSLPTGDVVISRDCPNT